MSDFGGAQRRYEEADRQADRGSPIRRCAHQPPPIEAHHERRYQSGSLIMPNGSVVSACHDVPLELSLSLFIAVIEAWNQEAAEVLA